MQKLSSILFTLLSIALGMPTARAQFAFRDAQTLEKTQVQNAAGRVSLPITQDVIALVRQYVPATATSPTLVVQAFGNNPFITFYTAPNPAEAENFMDLQMAALSLPGSVGGLDVTNIANGVAALLVERAKQELNIAFFQRFQKFADDHHEFQLLFPKTTYNLTKLLSFSYPQLLPILRNGFFSDLKTLPAALPGLLTLDPYDKFFEKYPELSIALRSMKLITDIQSGASSPAEMLNDFAAFPEWSLPGNTSLMNNLGASIRLAALLSQSMRTNDTGQVWVSPKDVKPLLTDRVLQTIYLGLLWQSANSAPQPIVFYLETGKKDTLTTLLSANSAKITQLLTDIDQFIAIAANVNAGFKTIVNNNHSGKPNTNTDYYNFIGSAIDAIDTAFSLVDVFEPALNAKPYLDLARKGNVLYKDIYSEQYTQTISDALDFLKQIGELSNGFTTVITEPSPAQAAVMSAEDKKVALKQAAKEKTNVLEQLTEFAEEVKPFVLFMANLLEANSSSDVQAALDNAILPVGSSSIKKHTRNNLAIQAYLGGYYVTSYNGNNVAGMWGDKFGVTAPIGIAYTPGFASRGNYGSLSIFVSAFDLGAIVDYELHTDSVTTSSGTPTTALSKNYSIQLGQILSPGAYIVYGAGANLPLALAFGAQYGPGLSKIDTQGNANVINPSWRFNLFLTVDLPLFNIWNVTKTKIDVGIH